MTNAQTNRVHDRVNALARDWLLAQGASSGRYGGASAFADLDLDCYVGSVTFTYTGADGTPVEGKLTWRIDHTFENLGQPEVRTGEGDKR